MGRKIKTLTNMMKLLFCVLAFLAAIHANNWPQPDSERCIKVVKALNNRSYAAGRTCKEHLTTWVPTCIEEIREEIRGISLASRSAWQEAVSGKMLQCLKKRSEDAVPEESFCFDCLCKMNSLLPKELKALNLC